MTSPVIPVNDGIPEDDEAELPDAQTFNPSTGESDDSESVTG